VSGILKKAGTPNSRCKKVRVRWPDLSDQAEQQQQGFRIAAPVRPVSAGQEGWGGCGCIFAVHCTVFIKTCPSLHMHQLLWSVLAAIVARIVHQSYGMSSTAAKQTGGTSSTWYVMATQLPDPRHHD
jgi:hypothetical protein